MKFEERRIAIENEYGPRQAIPMAHGDLLREQHFKGVLDDGRKFVYCPIGFILSWNSADYDHEWCHWCKKNFDEIIAIREMDV